MNRGYCNSCQKLVPAEPKERENKIFLAKTCPECGVTETLISSDATRYWQKRALDTGFDYRGCGLSCLECKHAKQPNIIFLDITNRCNLNCPICINNTPSMGFLFEPPFEYFEKIFDNLAEMDPKPSVQLFGGEPTVRKDLIEIIQAARKRGLATRVVTNGINLADQEYCRKLVENRATILIAFDGQKREVYKILRGSDKMLDKKVQALDNLSAMGKGKVTLMSLVARGFNDDEVSSLLQFAHDRRNVVRAIYFMPLAQTWDTDEFDLTAESTTSEDIEQIVDEAFPDDHIAFLPAGLLGQLESLMYCLKTKTVPFMGAHPNCESMYLMLSDGTKYIPISRFLKHGIMDAAQALIDLDKRLYKHVEKRAGHSSLQRRMLGIRAMLGVAKIIRKNVRLGSVLKGRGIGKAYHALAMLLGFIVGRKSRYILPRHLTAHQVLQIITLPFEDKTNIETDRLERCPAAFAYYDPQEDQVRHVPVCAWGLHKNKAMKMIADYYGKHEKQTTEPAAPTGADVSA